MRRACSTGSVNKAEGHFLSLLPAGACAFRGVAVVAAMMPHVPKGGFYEAFRYSITDSVFGFATDRPRRASACKPHRQRRKESGRQALEGKAPARACRPLSLRRCL